jgi:ParB-like chromosome segregation protein Spo0J
VLHDTGNKKVPVGSIIVGDRWRKPTDEQIEKIKESINANGLVIPIGVRLVEPTETDGEQAGPIYKLIYGATRLAATKALGLPDIRAQVFEGNDVDFEKAELVENLHHSELTKLERDEQMARYVRLCEEEVSRQVGGKPQGGRPEGGISAAARELGKPETTVRRAVKTAQLTEAAVAAIHEHGLADTQTAYLAVADETTEEAQLAKVEEIVEQKERRASAPASDTRARQVFALRRQWNKASSKARKEFLAQIGHATCSATASAAPAPRRANQKSPARTAVADVPAPEPGISQRPSELAPAVLETVGNESAEKVQADQVEGEPSPARQVVSHDGDAAVLDAPQAEPEPAQEMSVAAEPAAEKTRADQAADQPRPTSAAPAAVAGPRSVAAPATSDLLEIPAEPDRRRKPAIAIATVAEGNHIVPGKAAAAPASAS